MDFSRDLMESRGYGDYVNLDPALARDAYVAYRTSLSEGTEVFHNNIRERWSRGDPAVLEAMNTWASYAEQGRDCLLRGDSARLSELIDANFDLRARLYNIGAGNREMIDAARSVGASANFAGSGGAIVGLYRDEDMFARLTQAMQAIGVAVIKPRIAANSLPLGRSS